MVGRAVQFRYLERERDPAKGTKFNPSRVIEGYKATRHANPVADASMILFDEYGEPVLDPPYDELKWYQKIYNIETDIVWKRRSFSAFINLLTWRAEVKSLKEYKIADRDRACEKEFLALADLLIARMYPNAAITSDRGLRLEAFRTALARYEVAGKIGEGAVRVVEKIQGDSEEARASDGRSTSQCRLTRACIPRPKEPRECSRKWAKTCCCCWSE